MRCVKERERTGEQFDNSFFFFLIDVSFSCVCPVFDQKFRHNMRIHNYLDNVVMTKLMFNNRTDA